ncbi:MAG TPA: TorF family putative porin [Gammaproteobacteria bacterium]|nr:TorF family putative porin [Gammaproteobacteria bacterium]
MKKMNEKLLAGVLAVSALAGAMITSAAHAGVDAAVGASNMYYWRGYDLGADDGGAAVWGDLKASIDAGVYGGVWMSSGDNTSGTEYDLYFGYGTKLGDFGIDLSYWSYNYPSRTPDVTYPLAKPVEPFDFAEVVLALSYGPVALTYYDNVAPGEDLNGPGADFGSEDYSYFTLAYTYEAWNFKYGQHSDVDGSPYDGYSHFDITYAFNDKVSFTLGNVIDDVDNKNNDQAKFVVNLTLPIE